MAAAKADRAITAADYVRAQRIRGRLREAYDHLLEKVDAVCTPALGFLAAVATPLEADLETALAGDDPFGSAGNLLGLPSIALPGPNCLPGAFATPRSLLRIAVGSVLPAASAERAMR